MLIKEIIQERTTLLEKEKKLYLTTVNQINSQMKDLLKNDFGVHLVKNCGWDLAGELVRNFFDTSDYHITVDQMVKRNMEFEYDHEYAPLETNGDIAQLTHNYNDGPNSETLQNMVSDLEQSKTKLFEKEKVVDGTGKVHSRYKDRQMIHKGKETFRKERESGGDTVRDDYTGMAESKKQNALGREVSNLDVDHTQALSTAYVYNRYLKEGAEARIKAFYNSSDNFSMMFKTANQSKGDVQVKDKNGNDITFKASPDQIAGEVVKRWEGIKDPEAREKLRNSGYLNADGKVPSGVKRQLVSDYRRSQNKESKTILKETDYASVAKDAGKHTAKGLGKIVAGQVIYYTVPPLLYEVKVILKDKNITFDNAMAKLKKAGSRLCKYVVSKLAAIFKGIMNNSLKKFIKAFFDILINMVKATVKKILKLAKSLVLAVVDSIKILADKKATPAQKADSIFNLLSVTVTSFVIEVLFEYVEKQFNIPEPLLLPLQVITTVVCTNFSLLILQKADLFNVRHGLLLANIESVFDKENRWYAGRLELLLEAYQDFAEQKVNELKDETEDIKRQLKEKSVYDNLQDELERVNALYNMGIDFDQEWAEFIGYAI